MDPSVKIPSPFFSLQKERKQHHLSTDSTVAVRKKMKPDLLQLNGNDYTFKFIFFSINIFYFNLGY